MQTLFFLLWFYGGITGINTADSPAISQKSTEVALVFSHYFGNQPFAFRQKYATVFGDTVDFERFQYYVSNIELVSTEGKIWREPNSYHLLVLKPQEGNQLKILLKDVPFKQIKQIRWGIGVDTTRNHGGIQNGDLDPIKGMFWTWSQGYIFFKCEGYHYQNPSQRRGLIFHIGGDECYRPVELTLSSSLRQTLDAKTPQIPVRVNLGNFFGGFLGAGIDLRIPEDGSAINVMGGPKSSQIADNYTRLFSLESPVISGE